MQKPSEMYDFLVKSYPPKIAEEIFRIKSYFKYWQKIDVDVLFLTAIGLDDAAAHIQPSEIVGFQQLIYVGEFYPTKADLVLGSGEFTLRSMDIYDVTINALTAPINVMVSFDSQWEGYMNGNIYKVVMK